MKANSFTYLLLCLLILKGIEAMRIENYGTISTATSVEAVDATVSRVAKKAEEWNSLPIQQKIDLLEKLISNTIKYRDEWITQQQMAKGVDPNNPLHGYGQLEITVTGPGTFGGYANGILKSLRHCQKNGVPPQPRDTKTLSCGKTFTTIWPSRYSLLDQ